MFSSPDALSCIGGLMAQRLDISLVNRKSFQSGSGMSSSVVNSYRLLFVHSGLIHYTLEGWTGEVGNGGLLLVPAWMKRGWQVQKRHMVDLSWVEFNPLAEAVIPTQPFYWKSDDPSREAGTLLRLSDCWKKKPRTHAIELMMEGELKALLGRLAGGHHDSPSNPSQNEIQSPAIIQEVISVAGWIEQHYARPDVLDVAMRQIRSSDHYFRTRFREHTGFTLGQYTAMVRMRRARYLLTTSPSPIKDVAWQVGFRDPLHFSRCYRKFRGISPRADCR